MARSRTTTWVLTALSGLALLAACGGGSRGSEGITVPVVVTAVGGAIPDGQSASAVASPDAGVIRVIQVDVTVETTGLADLGDLALVLEAPGGASALQCGLLSGDGSDADGCTGSRAIRFSSFSTLGPVPASGCPGSPAGGAYAASGATTGTNGTHPLAGLNGFVGTLPAGSWTLHTTGTDVHVTAWTVTMSCDP